MNRSWEDETYPTEVGMKSKIKELERELQDAKKQIKEAVKLFEKLKDGIVLHDDISEWMWDNLESEAGEPK